MSSNTDEAPYAVVASGRLEARGDIRRITIHCIEHATNRFRIAGFRYTDNNDQGTSWQYPTQVSFIAMDD